MTTLTTKYGHGDVVWHRRQATVRETAICPLCGGACRVPIAESLRYADCPECGYGSEHRAGWGKIHTGRVGHVAIIEERTIGQVRVEWTAGEEPVVTYMAWESGVGSGSVLYEKDLYPTREAAEAVPLPDPVEPTKKRGHR